MNKPLNILSTLKAKQRTTADNKGMLIAKIKRIFEEQLTHGYKRLSEKEKTLSHGNKRSGEKENMSSSRENMSSSRENTKSSRENKRSSRENTRPSRENTRLSRENKRLSRENKRSSRENTMSSRENMISSVKNTRKKKQIIQKEAINDFIKAADNYLHYSNDVCFYICNTPVATSYILITLNTAGSVTGLMIIVISRLKQAKYFVLRAERTKIFDGVIERYCGVPP